MYNSCLFETQDILLKILIITPSKISSDIPKYKHLVYSKSMLKLGRDYTIDNLLLSRKKTYQIQPQLTCVPGVERTPDAEDTSDNSCTKPDPRYPTRLSVKVNCLFHIYCAFFYMNAVIMVQEI